MQKKIVIDLTLLWHQKLKKAENSSISRLKLVQFFNQNYLVYFFYSVNCFEPAFQLPFVNLYRPFCTLLWRRKGLEIKEIPDLQKMTAGWQKLCHWCNTRRMVYYFFISPFLLKLWTANIGLIFLIVYILEFVLPKSKKLAAEGGQEFFFGIPPIPSRPEDFAPPPRLEKLLPPQETFWDTPPPPVAPTHDHGRMHTTRTIFVMNLIIWRHFVSLLNASLDLEGISSLVLSVQQHRNFFLSPGSFCSPPPVWRFINSYLFSPHERGKRGKKVRYDIWQSHMGNMATRWEQDHT